MLNYCIEFPGVFILGTRINDEYDANLPFINFHHYENISSCYLNKQILPENFKTCPSCMNIENVEKVKFTTRESLVLKLCSILDFHSKYYIPAIENRIFICHMFTSLEKSLFR